MSVSRSKHTTTTTKDMFNIMTQKYLDNVLNKQDGLSELEVKFGTKGIKQITKDSKAAKLIGHGVCSQLASIASPASFELLN